MKKKIILLYVFFIIFSFIFINNNTFAYSLETNRDGVLVSCDDKKVNAIKSLEYYGDTNYAFFYSLGYLRVMDLNSVQDFKLSIGLEYRTHSNKSIRSHSYVWNNDTNTFDFQTTHWIDWANWNVSVSDMYVSNLIIYNDTNFSEDSIFFQQTPLTMKKIMEQAGKQAELEVVQIIMIAIMTTVGLTVLLIGFKKGLTVLTTGFRH